MNLFIFACQGCPGWQQVDAAQEEEEEEVTGVQEDVLDAVQQLGKASTSAVAKLMGANRGNTWKKLQLLWHQGKLEREVIGEATYYFLKKPEIGDQPK